MKVLLISNYLPDQQRSMLGFASALHKGLLQKNVDVRVLTPTAFAGRLIASRPAHRGARKWLGYIDKFVLFPVALKRAAKNADIVHICDHGNALYVKYLKGKPHLVTCHDLLAVQAARGEFPGWTTGKSGQKFQQFIVLGLEKSQFVVCVSQHTEQELHRLAPQTRPKTTLIYNGFYNDYSSVSPVKNLAWLEAFGLTGQSFLLHVGGNQFYKNRLRVLEIFHALRENPLRHELRLVMAGKTWTPAMRAFVAAHNLEDHVLELVDLSNDELRALYSCAKALVFPSLAEGFGLPIIEAQACRCPVFTTGKPPMNEVGGEGAIYFDPDDVEAAAQIIDENLDHTENVVEAGLKNIERFSTEKMLDGYISVYQQILDKIKGATAT